MDLTAAATIETLALRAASGMFDGIALYGSSIEGEKHYLAMQAAALRRAAELVEARLNRLARATGEAA